MEVEKRKLETEKKENEIVYSKAIKAGKRIYYLDVKKSRNNDLFLAITESKKKVVGFEEDVQVTFEKHKIFLYKEDFDKFIEGLEDVISFIKSGNEEVGKQDVQSDSPTTDTNTEDNSSNVETKSTKGFFNKFKF